MKTVKVLKSHPYGGKHRGIGQNYDLRDDHANLLQQLGLIVIEISPIVMKQLISKTETDAKPTKRNKRRDMESEGKCESKPDSEKESLNT